MFFLLLGKAMKKTNLTIEQIKKLVIVGMFADDILMEKLVLKGGNALDLILAISSRSSVDVDFSLPDDLPGGLDDASRRIQRALSRTFDLSRLVVFDFHMVAKPNVVSDDVAQFWGGYAIEFKLVDQATYNEFKDDVEKLRRVAIPLGQSTKLLIDISRFEHTLGKQAHELDGYRIYAYSPLMLACEKLRAICQQMPEYGHVVHRDRPGAARARDFLDLHTLIEHFNLDLANADSLELLKAIFEAKRVPIELLGKVGEFRDFHKADWPNVVATVKAGKPIKDFDFYFDYVVELNARLKAFWNV
jgi:hypothetical protein